jgi:hypothetical protein
MRLAIPPVRSPSCKKGVRYLKGRLGDLGGCGGAAGRLAGAYCLIQDPFNPAADGCAVFAVARELSRSHRDTGEQVVACAVCLREVCECRSMACAIKVPAGRLRPLGIFVARDLRCGLSWQLLRATASGGSFTRRREGAKAQRSLVAQCWTGLVRWCEVGWGGGQEFYAKARKSRRSAQGMEVASSALGVDGGL